MDKKCQMTVTSVHRGGKGFDSMPRAALAFFDKIDNFDSFDKFKDSDDPDSPDNPNNLDRPTLKSVIAIDAATRICACAIINSILWRPSISAFTCSRVRDLAD